jgi:hypothetical protein
VIVDEEACREGAVRYIKGGMHQAGSNKLVNSKLFTMRSVHFLPAYILARDYASFGADGRSFEGAGAACLARSCGGVVVDGRAAFRRVQTMLGVFQMAGCGARDVRPLFGIGHSRYRSTIFCHPGSIILAPSAHHSVEDERASSSFIVDKRLGVSGCMRCRAVAAPHCVYLPLTSTPAARYQPPSRLTRHPPSQLL